jgi:hypothetical protein
MRRARHGNLLVTETSPRRGNCLLSIRAPQEPSNLDRLAMQIE